jgi:hypothetical protein
MMDREAVTLSSLFHDKYLTWASASLDVVLCLRHAAIAEGRYSQVSEDFTAITGREPESFCDFLL